MKVSLRRPGRRGFTLVELVVVILVLGIIAAVAAPKLFNVADNAKSSALKESLAVVRDAIQLYNSQNGTFPGTDEATLKTALKPYLRGPFPACPLGNTNASIRVVTGDSAALAASGTEGWAYNNQTGEFIANSAAYAAL